MSVFEKYGAFNVFITTAADNTLKILCFFITKTSLYQIYWKFYHQKWNFSDKNSDIFFLFLLKT